MKISELIAELEMAMAEHGDIPVRYQDELDLMEASKLLSSKEANGTYIKSDPYILIV